MNTEAMATTHAPEEVGERKEDEDKTTEPKKEKEEEGDECPISLDEVSLLSNFKRFVKEVIERKEEEDKATEPKKEDGDECPICLEELPKDPTQFSWWTCCGNGMHIHCTADLQSMKMDGTCPLCRAKTATSHEEAVAQIHPWVKKKKRWAQYMMGQHYRDGHGVKQSHEMARRLFELAAQQGEFTSMYHLGHMYRTGQGVEQSYERAFAYYEQAADLGFAGAQYNLGIMYFKGLGIERRDMVKAKKWFAKAAAQGDEDALKTLQRLDQAAKQ